jgi:hypothetical protein
MELYLSSSVASCKWCMLNCYRFFLLSLTSATAVLPYMYIHVSFGSALAYLFKLAIHMHICAQCGLVSMISGCFEHLCHTVNCSNKCISCVLHTWTWWLDLVVLSAVQWPLLPWVVVVCITGLCSLVSIAWCTYLSALVLLNCNCAFVSTWICCICWFIIVAL